MENVDPVATVKALCEKLGYDIKPFVDDLDQLTVFGGLVFTLLAVQLSNKIVDILFDKEKELWNGVL